MSPLFGIRARVPLPRRTEAFSLGRLVGIPVFVHYTWLLIFLLITWTIEREFAASHPNWLPIEHWFAGLLTSLAFFTCVFLHEMGHSLVARAFGLPVLSITLFIFGGVAQIKGEPRKPAHEFWIAIAGPAMSVALAVLFFTLAGTTKATATDLPMFRAICLWLGWINSTLAIFNMIPGFPLDGGRVLRSALWKLTGRFERATRAAAGLGTLVAYFFIAGGIYLASTGEFQGLWLSFLGLFLLMAARGSLVQLATRQALEGLQAGDILEPLPSRVSPGMSVQGLVEGPILRQGLDMFVVEDDGALRGLITLREVNATPRDEWANTPLQSIMVPAGDLVPVESARPLLAVMEIMDERGLHHLPVVEGESVVGMVTRERLFRVLRNQMQFGGR